MSQELLDFFSSPSIPRQKIYEAIRALVVEQLPPDQVALKFGYKVNSLKTLYSNAKGGKIELFPETSPGPKDRRTSPEVRQRVINLRTELLSTTDIGARLAAEGISISNSSVERILKDAGFPKLHRRTQTQRGFTLKGKTIPERSAHLDFKTLKPFSYDCPVAGVFQFLPYIVESGIVEAIEAADLPASNQIGAVQACMAILLLKLIGRERLSQMQEFDHEPGLGVFAGLNVLPKATYMGTYSCLCSEQMMMDFQQKVMTTFISKYPEFYKSAFVNLDFHSIPHYGELSEMEKIWCGAKGKAHKAANTVLAQDSQSNAILYTRADILRKDETQEVLNFVHYWKQINGNLSQTLVFDCKFTSYPVLDQLAEEGAKFITLRKRNKKLIQQALEIPKEQWTSVKLPIPKRKHPKVSLHEQTVRLPGSNHEFRQIIIKDHGREKPTFIISNDMNLKTATVLEVYAKRWHIENKISELVSFFNLNALSSPLMIRIHFDIVWTLIADTLYRRMASDLKRHEKNLAQTIFQKFISMTGKVVYDGEAFHVKIRKRAHTPILKSIPILAKPVQVKWLAEKPVRVVWTP